MEVPTVDRLLIHAGFVLFHAGTADWDWDPGLLETPDGRRRSPDAAYARFVRRQPVLAPVARRHLDGFFSYAP